jgi:hypothetical protein
VSAQHLAKVGEGDAQVGRDRTGWVSYDLRHAAVSLWLNSGVPATEVARRAGHGVAVLLKIYAHCIDGKADAANKRITDALGTEAPQTAPGDDEDDDSGQKSFLCTSLGSGYLQGFLLNWASGSVRYFPLSQVGGHFFI